MKPITLGIVLALAVLVAGYMFTLDTAVPQATPPDLIMYANDTYGVSFFYPAGYILSEQEGGTAENPQYVITLIHEADAVPVVAGGEGPTAITIDIYHNSESLGVYDWITKANESNFTLGDGTYASTSVSTAEAVHYGWSGLYEGETVAFIHHDTIIAVSVTYLSPSDAIRDAYDTVVGTFTLR